MMDFEGYTKAVLKEVRGKAGDAFDVQLATAEKNNGIRLTGISAKARGRNGGPCIYLDSYFEGYKNGQMGTDRAAEDIWRKLMEHRDDIEGIDTGSFRKWETAGRHIYAKLINKEMNKGSLGDMPCREFLDLAVAYYIKVDGITGDGMAAFSVKNGHMEMWGQDEESLYRAASANMRLFGEPVFESMEEVLRHMLPGHILPVTEDAAGPGMYVLTSRSGLFGAAELLDGSTLKRIGDELGGDFIVLPSSIHESIIIPAGRTVSCQKLAAIVQEINRVQVDVEERLSDHVYLYERGEGVLRIAA